jgi:hypothetical protein
MTLDASGNLGLGTAGPAGRLHLYKAAAHVAQIIESDNGYNAYTNYRAYGGGWSVGRNGATGDFVWHTAVDLGGTQAMTLDANNYLRLASGGIQFNGDTAAANALDDYEEGTWTAAFVCGTSGTITIDANTGTYTKIGRKVTLCGYFSVTSVSSPVGSLSITGIPFSVGTGLTYRSTVSLSADSLENTARQMTGVIRSDIPGILIQSYENGVQSAAAGMVKANSIFQVNVTYFV